MREYLLLIVASLYFLSCASQKKEVVSKSTIKLEGRNTSIRDFINIDGYYPASERRYGGHMFFEDGTWVYFHFKEGSSDNEIKINLSKTIAARKSGKEIEWGAEWGVYAIQNDTIIVHSYDRPAFLKPWNLSETRYKVIDKQTIKGVYFKITTDDNYYETHSPWVDNAPLHFTPADSLPLSDNWLKEKKWIWRNESDWKEYMKKVEQKKK